MFNERPTRDEQTVALVQPEAKKALATKATIYTSKGDIVSLVKTTRDKCSADGPLH